MFAGLLFFLIKIILIVARKIARASSTPTCALTDTGFAFLAVYGVFLFYFLIEVKLIDARKIVFASSAPTCAFVFAGFTFFTVHISSFLT